MLEILGKGFFNKKSKRITHLAICDFVHFDGAVVAGDGHYHTYKHNNVIMYIIFLQLA